MGRLRQLLGLDEDSSNTEPDSGSAPSASSDARPVSLEEVIRTRSRGTGSRGTKARERAQEAKEEEELDELFSPDNWREVSGLYFNVRYAMTGFEPFLLSEKQERVLATTMSVAMKKLLKINPAYIALLVFGVNFSTYAAQKELSYARAKQHADPDPENS